MSFTAWKKLDQQSIVIKQLWIFISLLVGLNLCLLLGLVTTPSRLRIYIPPDLSHGAMLKPDKMTRDTVYAFTFQIFTALNSWPDSGTKEYEKNINAYRNYLTPAFYQKLQKDKQARTRNGELMRKRIMSGVSGMGYKPSDVKVLGNGTWLVNMHLQIIETLEGSVIKNVIMDYPLVVSQIHASMQVNPWGLQIAGFNKHPYRIKTIV